MLAKTLPELGFSENVSRLYLRLLEAGPSSARLLAENLNIPRPTVYDGLKFLIHAGLVVEYKQDNKKTFKVDDVKNLSRLLDSRIEKLAKEKESVNEAIKKLDVHASSIEPRIKFYSGVVGVKQVLMDLLWYQDIETLTMWPISEMVEILGKDYLADLNRRRIRQKISIRGIWPRDKAVDLKEYPFLGIGERHLRELRFAPKDMTWNMSYWLYADKVAFVASHYELFGFVIHSKDFVELQKSQFEVIWKMSESIKPQAQYTDTFLKTV